MSLSQRNQNLENVSGLVHDDKVHKRIYTDPAIFDLEMERIWGKSWIYVGHESQVAEAGQYYSTTIGSQPVILTRHKNGEIYVLFNRCAHKGAQLVGDSSGEHDSNWKFFLENLNDMMHPMIVHQSSSMTARKVAKRELGPDTKAPSAIEIIAPFTEGYDFCNEVGLHAFPYGHGYSGGKTSIHANYSDIAEYNEAMYAAYGKESKRYYQGCNSDHAGGKADCG